MTTQHADEVAPRPFDALEPSLVADPGLAAEGEWRVAWARSHMPVLGRLRTEMERDRPLAGHRIGCGDRLDRQPVDDRRRRRGRDDRSAQPPDLCQQGG
jgi:hypothetical protein